MISPRDGEVEAWIDLAGLLPLAFRRDPEEVLNGIAYDARTGHLLVTGKGWPRLFEIEVLPAPGGACTRVRSRPEWNPACEEHPVTD